MAALADTVPPSLAPFAARLAVGAGRGTHRVADLVGSRATFALATAAFARHRPAADERAVLSYWTQFYFAALVIPVVVATVRLRRVLPMALDAVGCDLAADGTVDRLWLPHEGRASASDDPWGEGTAALVALHLRPFVERCVGWSGLSRRVLWCNAGTMLDYAARELDVAPAALRGRADAAGAGGACDVEALLFRPHRPAPADQARRRSVCCLRYRLGDVPDCGATCPLVGRAAGDAGPILRRGDARPAPNALRP